MERFKVGMKFMYKNNRRILEILKIEGDNYDCKVFQAPEMTIPIYITLNKRTLVANVTGKNIITGANLDFFFGAKNVKV